MLKTTTWRPSTCGCVLEYEWDTELSEDKRTHKFVKVQHCGNNHPKAVIGGQVEGSKFHEHHKVESAKIPAANKLTPASKVS